MALGNSYQSSNQGNNANQMWEASYYSRLRIKNPTDNIALSFTFWKGVLKVSIIEIGSNNELAYIHLSPTKARILASGVENIINNPEDMSTFGVDTGVGETRGFIAIGRDANSPFLFIAKVDKNGKYESSQRFNFNVNYNYLLKVVDITNLKCQKEYTNDVELHQFVDLLNDFARSASGALGASFYDIGRYESAKLNNIVRRIAEKTGVVDSNKSYNNGGGNRSNSSFFNSVDNEYEAPSNVSANKRSSYQSIDDLESELG